MRCDRYNKGKNRLALITPIALWELARVYTHGAIKYADDNWTRGAPYREVLDCALRHIVKWSAGHRNDEESGLHHLSHALWNIAMLLHMEKLPGQYASFDDRLKCSRAIPNGSGEQDEESPPV